MLYTIQLCSITGSCVTFYPVGQRLAYNKNYLHNWRSNLSFMKQVKELRKAHNFSPDMIINMDETPLYFDMPASHTVNKKGERQIRVKSTGAEKRCFTVILAYTCSIRSNASPNDHL